MRFFIKSIPPCRVGLCTVQQETTTCMIDIRYGVEETIDHRLDLLVY